MLSPSFSPSDRRTYRRKGCRSCPTSQTTAFQQISPGQPEKPTREVTVTPRRFVITALILFSIKRNCNRQKQKCCLLIKLVTSYVYRCVFIVLLVSPPFSRILFIPRFYPPIFSPPLLFLSSFITSSLKLTEEILDHSGDSMSIHFAKD